MARVTVEDVVREVGNRFVVVLLAARRARQLQVGGMKPLVKKENEKGTVTALREIEKGEVTEDSIDKDDRQARAQKESATAFHAH